MAHITGEDRSQLLLLPRCCGRLRGAGTTRSASLTHLLTASTLRRLDFSGFGPTTRAVQATIPRDLLKLYIYGYLNRIRSSRRLEVETHRNLEVIWLLRQLKPDFKTIADFRRDNRSAFRAVFRQFVRCAVNSTCTGAS